MLTEFGLDETLMAIHAEEARCELRRARLSRGEEVHPQGRPVRWGSKLLSRLGHLLVALGRRLERYRMPPTELDVATQVADAKRWLSRSAAS